MDDDVEQYDIGYVHQQSGRGVGQQPQRSEQHSSERRIRERQCAEQRERVQLFATEHGCTAVSVDERVDTVAEQSVQGVERQQTIVCGERHHTDHRRHRHEPPRMPSPGPVVPGIRCRCSIHGFHGRPVGVTVAWSRIDFAVRDAGSTVEDEGHERNMPVVPVSASTTHQSHRSHIRKEKHRRPETTPTNLRAATARDGALPSSIARTVGYGAGIPRAFGVLRRALGDATVGTVGSVPSRDDGSESSRGRGGRTTRVLRRRRPARDRRQRLLTQCDRRCTTSSQVRPSSWCS